MTVHYTQWEDCYTLEKIPFKLDIQSYVIINKFKQKIHNAFFVQLLKDKGAFELPYDKLRITYTF